MNIQAVLVPVIVCPPHGFAHRVISNDMTAVFGQLLQQSALGGRQGLGGAIRQADQSIGQIHRALAQLERFCGSPPQFAPIAALQNALDAQQKLLR